MANVNTAPEQVLMALAEDLTKQDFKTIEDFRLGNDITAADEVTKIEGVDSAALSELSKLVGVTSRYFVVSVSVKTGNLERKAKVVLRRPDIAKVAADEAPPTIGIIYYKSGV